MTRIRYLTLLMLLLGSISLWAQDDPFDPASPQEPGPPGGNVPMLSLLADPVDGGTVTGAGWYDVGSQVMVRAINKANYVFDHWENGAGETISTAAQFRYTKQEGNETLTAFFRFSPDSPAEPTEADIAHATYYQLTLVAEEGGTVSGGGRYLPNSRVYLKATVNTGFEFLGWYDSSDVLVSATANFYYVTTEEAVTLTARFRFNPSSPGEPTEPVFDTTPSHSVTVTAEEGGTVNTSGAMLKEGASITLTATVNTGYVFMGWYVDGELYNPASSFKYTMGTADIAFVARFTFNPSSPGEPNKPTTTRSAFYLMNVVSKPGVTARYPIYLSSIDELTDISFLLTFPNELQPDLTAIEMSSKAEGYTVTGTYLGENVYSFSLTGGTMPEGNTPLLVLNVPIPADIATAQNYQVKISDVIITLPDGSTLSSSTRNGRISVYKKGDTNGDNTVNALDVLNMAKVAVNMTTAVFIQEVSDINDDHDINALDVLGVAKIAVNLLK